MRSRAALLPLCVLLAASSAHSQDIYAAVGGQIVIPLETRLDHTTGLFCSSFVWRYQKSPDHFLMHIAELSNDCKKTECRRPDCSLSNNGTLILHRVTHQDSGLYTIVTYHRNKAKNTEKSFQLHVLDVVSDPVVKLRCPLNDSLLVTCSVEGGTRPQILLTINGEMFRESKSGQINETKSSPPPWNISCSANNEVSQKVTNVFSKACPDPLLDPVLDVSCHPDGAVEICCVVKFGSDPLYSWIVDGQPLKTDTNSSWSASGNRIMGIAVSPWNVSCLAWNVVSQVQSPWQVIHCHDVDGKLDVAELYVKAALFAMYNVLLIQGLLWMRTKAAANP